MDLDAAEHERLDEPRRRDRIALRRRHDVRERFFRPAQFDRPQPHPVEIFEEPPAVSRAAQDERIRRRAVVVDDVAETPPASRPRIREVDHHLVAREARIASAKLPRLDVYGARDGDARRLAQNADLIVPPDDRVRGALPVGVEVRVRNDAREAALLARELHRGADEVHRAVEDRIDVRVGRRVVGRQEEPSAGAPHLVHVEHGLRHGALEEEIEADAGLREVQHEPIAVVVVAGVVVIEPRHRSALVLGAEPTLVPVDDHLLAVGVHRDDVEDRLLEGLREAFAPAGRDVVGELERHLRGADLGRVEARRYHRDDFALGDERLGLGGGERARVGEAPRDLHVPVEPLEVLGRRENDRDHRPAERGGADPFHQHPRRGLVEELEVAPCLFVIGERAIGADFEAEIFGGGFESGRRSAREGQGARRSGERGEHGDNGGDPSAHANILPWWGVP